MILVWLAACCQPPEDGRLPTGTYGGQGVELRVRMDATADLLWSCEEVARFRSPLMLSDGQFSGTAEDGTALEGQACGEVLTLQVDGEPLTLTRDDAQLDCTF